ncbi:hypothetical protein J3R82DRAFT_213 [Butyriboletus roseoflavus]|nr:hypothetical protein J3R82DRAFT_213 [Butyriboletus roseoflavus]
MRPYCERCDRDFQSWPSYHQHISDSSSHNVCDDCDEDFDSWWGLKQHYVQSPRHHYCRRCDTEFEDDEDLIDHCLDEHDYCEECDRFFRNAFGLQEHNRQSHHYCVDCRRFFNSESNLRAHLKSSVHRPKNVLCAFEHRGCRQSFVSKSAMILHLESGSCMSGADRTMINRWVRLQDRNNIVTVPSRLLTNGGATPKYVATERSWNCFANAYECVLCHGTFRTLDALNRHLASPRHEERSYRCPLSTCLTKFHTLSALCQHVESESCGVLRFKAAQEGMDGLLDNMHRLRIQGE